MYPCKCWSGGQGRAKTLTGLRYLLLVKLVGLESPSLCRPRFFFVMSLILPLCPEQTTVDCLFLQRLSKI